MNERPQAPGRIDVAAIARSERFAAGINALARELGRSEAELRSEALAFLNELRTAHSPRVHSWVVRAGRALCRMGYERIDYDPEQLAVVRPLMQRCPSVVLASHRSYLDGGALTVGFHDHFLPPLVVFAGINMAFWPVGSIWRLANNVFIRRGSAGPVYKFVLRHYLGALLEGDRHLQWVIEGTRSRTGRLGRPRLGLLVYLLEAGLEGHADDLVLLPTSVA
ncbi:MAG TPA: 1-acyl-sn-glycerol-3-phosphate acyltransferase, partial [Steroidobacteraceae bacterium]|nr:1-acyl-sn-glycerol-3-phosphate acyltransferase [Steroidobacteraceae bacterium]